MTSIFWRSFPQISSKCFFSELTEDFRVMKMAQMFNSALFYFARVQWRHLDGLASVLPLVLKLYERKRQMVLHRGSKSWFRLGVELQAKFKIIVEMKPYDDFS